MRRLPNQKILPTEESVLRHRMIPATAGSEGFRFGVMDNNDVVITSGGDSGMLLWLPGAA